MTDNLEIIKYIDSKFRSQKNFLIVILIVFISAFLSIGTAGVKTLSSIKTKQDIIWVEYVPGDLLWEIIFSYDIQYKWLLELEAGDKEGALKVLEEFREYRRQSYDIKFDRRTRGNSPSIKIEFNNE